MPIFKISTNKSNNKTSVKNTALKYTSLALLVSLPFALPISAQAGTYYNCANPTGCVAVKEKTAKSDYTETKYPVVLAHGMSGWSRMFGFIDYFHGIPKELIKGGSDVYATKTSAIHNSEFRGEQLLQQVKTIAAVSGKDKVNLLGHSQGGIDIRYVAGVAPEYVASVTAISSPEQGSKTADWALKNIAGGTELDGVSKGDLNLTSKIIMSFLNFVGGFADVGSGISLAEIQQQDGWESANGLTAGYMQNFNAKFPSAMPSEYCGYPTETKVNGIPYYSFSGVGQVTNVFDVIDYPLALTALAFEGDPNDGLVSACSSRLGYVIRDDYHMNHLDSINQMVGLTSWRETNPVTVYRNHINRLKETDGL